MGPDIPFDSAQGDHGSINLGGVTRADILRKSRCNNVGLGETVTSTVAGILATPILSYAITV